MNYMCTAFKADKLLILTWCVDQDGGWNADGTVLSAFLYSTVITSSQKNQLYYSDRGLTCMKVMMEYIS